MAGIAVQVSADYYPTRSEDHEGSWYWTGSTWLSKGTSRADQLSTVDQTLVQSPIPVYTFYARAAAADPLGFHRMAAMQFVRTVAEVIPKPAVYGKVSGGILDLWVIVPDRDHEVQFAIAEHMCNLMRAYPDLAFDFMVLDERSSGAADASASGYLLLSGDWVARGLRDALA